MSSWDEPPPGPMSLEWRPRRHYIGWRVSWQVSALADALLPRDMVDALRAPRHDAIVPTEADALRLAREVQAWMSGHLPALTWEVEPPDLGGVYGPCLLGTTQDGAEIWIGTAREYVTQWSAAPPIGICYALRLGGE